MSSLHARLQRIRSGKAEGKGQEASDTSLPAEEAPAAFLEGWELLGDQVAKRVAVQSAPALSELMHPALALLFPDLLLYRQAANGMDGDATLGDLLFFDLETTGLSSGSGTVAFLAAFGRLAPCGEGYHDGVELHIAQYLLLDYPGEAFFVQALVDEFGLAKSATGRPPLVITYNGKCFDAQILKTRCIMLGIPPPRLLQGDLLYPARRIWKRTLPSCSQSCIETTLLGIDRTDDIPGALAPEIWFSFLKTKNPEPLLRICEHNARDIYGMAALLGAIAEIARDPCTVLESYQGDVEQLALHWKPWLRRWSALLSAQERLLLETMGQTLLIRAAAEHPLAALRYGQNLLHSAQKEEGRSLLIELSQGYLWAKAVELPDSARTGLFRMLAVDAEYALKDKGRALAFTEKALAQKNIGQSALQELLRRKARLEKELAP